MASESQAYVVRYIIANSEAPFNANLRAITTGNPDGVVYVLPNGYLHNLSDNVTNDLSLIEGFQLNYQFRIRLLPVVGDVFKDADTVLTYRDDVATAAYFTASGSIPNPILTFKGIA